jgi:hypothetical protein
MSTLSRFPVTNPPSADNTSAVLNNSVISVPYAASIALVTKTANSLVVIGQATGALSLTVGVGTAGPVADDVLPFVGDTLQLLLSSDATGRVVTFSTGFAGAGTLTMIASKKASIDFTFDGVAWVETGRSIGA